MLQLKDVFAPERKMNKLIENISNRITDYFKGVIDKIEDGWAVVDINADIHNILREEEKAYAEGWVPVNSDDEESFPSNNEYILLSLSNFSIPIVGRYEMDAEGGVFYCGDEDTTLVSQGMFVNAWMPLPKCYRED